MTNPTDTTTRADQLQQMRALLAALQREATSRGVAEMVDLVKKVDELAAELLRRKTI